MNDKFSILIMSLQSLLKRKNEEREEITQKRDPIVSQIFELSTIIQEEEENVTSLKKNLKKYKRYYFTLLSSLGHILFHILLQLAFLGAWGFFTAVIFMRLLESGFVNSTALLGYLAEAFISSVVVTLEKQSYKVIKLSLEEIKEGSNLRKKYSSSKDIQNQIQLVEDKLKKLKEEIEAFKNQDSELTIVLDNLSAAISILEKKLSLVKDRFIEGTFKLTDERVEERLDSEYEESYVEKELQAIDAEESKRFIIEQNGDAHS